MSRLETRPIDPESRQKPEVAHGTRQPLDKSLCALDVEDAGRKPRLSDVVPAGRPKATSQLFPVEGTRRELVQLAWPIAAAMLGETALGLVDTKLVGGLGGAALGGVGIATTIMYLFYSIVFGLMRGVKVRTAHAVGEGRGDDGYAYARAGVAIGLVVGIFVLLACRDVGPALSFVGVDPTIIPHARTFAAAVTLGAPATCALAALVQHRQAIGDSRTPMVVGIGGNVFNAILAYGLIYGHFGLPALGVRGGGYATALTELLEFGAMATLLVREERMLKRSGVLRSTMPFSAAARDVAELGVPTGMQFGAEMLAFSTFTAVLGGIGRDEIASHQIALSIIRVSFLPGIAVAEAASVLVGRALGRRKLPEADVVARDAIKLAVAFMAICGLVFALGGGVIARFFSSDPAVEHIARRLLLVAAIFQVLDAVNIVLRGSLRGAKDVRAVALIGIAVVWTFVPTSAWVFGKLAGLGAIGGWFGFLGETTFAAALFWMRWSRGGWRDKYRVAVT